ncbi:MAG TPA: phosphoribosylanthranilate isomerase [Gemmatimonadaceae bacterium]
MTRTEDVRHAVRLGAGFVGAILTESPRRVTPDQARTLFAALDGSPVRGVCVFGDEAEDQVIADAERAQCAVVQLHGRNGTASANRIREQLGVEIWQVVRVGADGLRGAHGDAANAADGILLDTMTGASLGGSGEAFDWAAVAGDLRELRFGHRLIVAGGLKPDNVRAAIELLAPDVVDVSSGVESAPGIKDHRRMADFMAAVDRSRAQPPA